MPYRILLSLLILISIYACKENNLIVIKDDAGRISEQYTIDKDSLKHGEYTAYINGTLIERAAYNAGQLHGKRHIFHSNGQIEIEETYDKGVVVGLYKSYFSDGTLAQTAHYEKGVMQGILKTFYKDGNLKEEVTMVDNQENGPFKEYFPSGQIKWEGQFLNGDNEFGLLKEYNKAGTLIKKMRCDSLGVCATIWSIEEGEKAPINH